MRGESNPRKFAMSDDEDYYGNTDNDDDYYSTKKAR